MLAGIVYKENYKMGSYHLYHYITYHYLSNHKLLDICSSFLQDSENELVKKAKNKTKYLKRLKGYKTFNMH